MAFFASIGRLFGSRGVSNPDTGYQVGALDRIYTDSGITVTDERALKVSAVWACVQLISNAVAGLPINIFRDTESGREPLKSRHYLTDLLHSRPNSMMKPRDFRLAMTVQMALWNNAYAEQVWLGDRVVALNPLRPGRMTPFITNGGELTYHYAVDTGVKVYAQKSIFHLKGFGTDGIVGQERNNYAREAYGLSVSADTYAAKQYANGGRPGGVLTVDQFLTKDQREQVREIYQGMSEGVSNSGKMWVLEGGMKYDAIDFNADQMQMLSTRMHQLSEIARFFGVPDVLIGAGSSKTSSWPASFEHQMLYFLTHTIQPYLDEWEAAIRYSLLPMGTNINVDHDTTPLVKMDSTAKATFLSTAVQNGLMTRNEARKLLNLPEMTGGDELTVQTNLANIEDLEVLGDDAQTTEPAGPMPAQIRQ
jgi:HK97 family phage portal protein